MNTPFLINPEATRHELVWEMHGLLDELEGSLCVLSVSAHADGLPEGPVLAVIRQTRSIRQLAELVTSKAHGPKDSDTNSDTKGKYIFSYDSCLEMAEELAEAQGEAYALVSTLERQLSPPETGSDMDTDYTAWNISKVAMNLLLDTSQVNCLQRVIKAGMEATS